MASETLEQIAKAEEKAAAVRAAARAEAAAKIAAASEKIKEELAAFRAAEDEKMSRAVEEASREGLSGIEKAAGEAVGYGVFLSDSASGKFEKAIGIIVNSL